MGKSVISFLLSNISNEWSQKKVQKYSKWGRLNMHLLSWYHPNGFTHSWRTPCNIAFQFSPTQSNLMSIFLITQLKWLFITSSVSYFCWPLAVSISAIAREWMRVSFQKSFVKSTTILDHKRKHRRVSDLQPIYMPIRQWISRFCAHHCTM